MGSPITLAPGVDGVGCEGYEGPSVPESRLKIGSTVGLWNQENGYFMRMNDKFVMDKSPKTTTGEFQTGWGWEKFVVKASPRQDGKYAGTIGLYSPDHNRFVRMPDSGPDSGEYLDSSPEGSELHPDWGWELFKVVNDESDERNVALWSPDHERFVRMPPDGDRMDRSNHHSDHEAAMPAHWTWELFRVVC